MIRITQAMSAQTALYNINQDLSSLQTTTQQLSTGLRINEPSDDPYGATVSMSLQAQITGFDQLTANINNATSWTDAANTALSNMNSIAQRARELVVSGANGTMSQTQLNSIADEIDQLTDSLKQSADAQFNGSYIFSGNASTTQPYATGPASSDTFMGNTNTISRLIAPGTTVPINFDISSLLGSGQSANDGKLLDTLRTISSDLRSGNTNGLQTDLKNLDGNMSTMQQIQADAGALSNRLSMTATQLSTMQASANKNLAGVQDVDFTKATVTYTTQQAAYQAALKASAGILQSSLLDFLPNA